MSENPLRIAVERTPDPLGMALAALEAEASDERFLQALPAILERYGDRWSVRHLPALQAAARRCAESGGSDAALERLENAENPAVWTCRSELFAARRQWRDSADAARPLYVAAAPGERGAAGLAVAERLLEADEPRAAAGYLRDAIRQPLSYAQLCGAGKLIRRLPADAAARRPCRIAVLGDITFGFWEPALFAACWAMGLEATFYAGQFDQYEQEIFASGGPLAEFAPDAILIAATWRSLGATVADPEAKIAETVERLQRLWAGCRRLGGARVLQFGYEVPEGDALGQLSAVAPQGTVSFFRRLNAALAESIAAAEGVHLLDVDRIASFYGKAEWLDERLWRLAAQYPSTGAIPELVRRIAATLAAAQGLASKCLALDLDNTLWGGVVGEDGPDGVRLGVDAASAGYLELQRFAAALAERGVLLAVCSKNNDADARAPFLRRSEMALPLDRIAAFVANWEPKPVNLRKIADLLNIGLDAIVFLDDNPAEREAVRRAYPEVQVVEPSGDALQYAQDIQRGLYFETVRVTTEDRQRTASARSTAMLRELSSSGDAVEDFLAALGMTATITPFSPPDVPRLAQLINKTNQFNLTGRRTTETQVRALCADEEYYTQSARLRDRHADHGLISALIAKREADRLIIRTWVMSCRVLGRGLEDLMMATLLEDARAIGVRRVVGEFVALPKNQQTAELYGRFGFDEADGEGSVRSFTLLLDARELLEAPRYIKLEKQLATAPTS